MAIRGRGTTAVAWTDVNADNGVVQAALRPPGEDWQPPRALCGAPAGGVDITDTQIAANARGDAAAVWMASEGATVHASTRPAGRGGQPPSDLLLAPSETPSAQTAIAVDPRGRAIAIGDHNRGPLSFVVQAASYR